MGAVPLYGYEIDVGAEKRFNFDSFALASKKSGIASPTISKAIRELPNFEGEVEIDKWCFGWRKCLYSFNIIFRDWYSNTNFLKHVREFPSSKSSKVVRARLWSFEIPGQKFAWIFRNYSKISFLGLEDLGKKMLRREAFKKSIKDMQKKRKEKEVDENPINVIFFCSKTSKW